MFDKSRQQKIIAKLYSILVAQARQPLFYRDYGVPDTFEGRFEMVLLHVFLVMRRLKREGTMTRKFNQRLFDYMFADIDRSIREAGVGDVSVSKYMKRFAQGFMGRSAAYDAALSSDQQALLIAALQKNVYAHESKMAEQLAVYVRHSEAHLKAQIANDLLAGHVDFEPDLTQKAA